MQVREVGIYKAYQYIIMKHFNTTRQVTNPVRQDWSIAGSESCIVNRDVSMDRIVSMSGTKKKTISQAVNGLRETEGKVMDEGNLSIFMVPSRY